MAKKNNNYAMNEEVNIGPFSFIVHKVLLKTGNQGLFSSLPNTNGIFVKIELSIINNGKKPCKIPKVEFNLIPESVAQNLIKTILIY